MCLYQPNMNYLLSVLCESCHVNSLNEWIMLGMRVFDTIIIRVGLGLINVIDHTPNSVWWAQTANMNFHCYSYPS